MDPLIILLYVLELTTAIVAIRQHFKWTACFLSFSFLLDIINLLITQYNNHYSSKPYAGINFLLWIISMACYLGICNLLCFITSIVYKNKKWACINIFVYFISIFYLTIYYLSLSDIVTSKLINIYYIIFMFINSLILISKIKAGFGMDKFVLLLCSIGGLTEFLIIQQYSFSKYYLLNISNAIFYLMVIAIIWMHGKLNRLIPV